MIPVAEPSVDIDRELMVLEAELKRLEAEYNMFFAGRLPRPPWETRGRVDAIVKRIDRMHISNYAYRFRFSTIQSRYATFVDLWDRGMRAREEGRPGPFAQPQPPKTATTTPGKPQRPDDRILHVTTFADPVKEIDKLRDLYHSVAEARRDAGENAIPFHRFADLVKKQVKTLKDKGSPEVAFRVAVKDGKVAFTAKPMRGSKDE
jgi:hypothetical protein